MPSSTQNRKTQAENAQNGGVPDGTTNGSAPDPGAADTVSTTAETTAAKPATARRATAKSAAAKPAAAKTPTTRAKPATARPAAATAAAATAKPKVQATATVPVPAQAPAQEQEREEPVTHIEPEESPEAAKADEKGSGRSVTVSIPVTLEQIIATYETISKLPTYALRRAVTSKRGLPVYLGIGGLAVVGIAEWPVAAVAGVGYAALRRWGPLPLRPAPAQDGRAGGAGKNSAAPEAEQVTIDEEVETAN